jgi:DNA-binding transcriptional MerR regulator
VNYSKFTKIDKLLDISTMAKELGLINKKTGKPNTHTLRFWEKQFKQIRPIRLNNSRRFYDQKTKEKIELIKFLLKDKGVTIKGVKDILKKKINSLDDYHAYSVKAEFLRSKFKSKAKKILNKLNKIKLNG